ncbi:MAG: peroxide stress protein YaaA [Austwickia sp.]|nr:peroxide stress protein YaaA [Austwickia sp.]MCO5308021.1 peroxide stress protein YaaA [Austwickia sp.]
MLILLPPSESKAEGRRGSRCTDPGALSFPALAPVRARVAAALAAASERPDAPALLGVSPNLIAEIRRNTRLATAPAVPAGRLYTGVLYDALDLPGLSPAAKRRATAWIVAVSALYGALRLSDRAAAYRLSMGADLPDLPRLAELWRPELDQVLTPLVRRGVVVDCRSAAYVAAWPPPAALADRWTQVRVPGASHWAKHTRGLVAHAICADGIDPRTVPDLAAALAEHFDVAAHEPPRPGKPWVLDVSPRGS